MTALREWLLTVLVVALCLALVDGLPRQVHDAACVGVLVALMALSLAERERVGRWA